MSGRPEGRPGPSGLDRTPFDPTFPQESSTIAQRTDQYLAQAASNTDVQNRSTSGQDRNKHKAALEQAFAAVNFGPATVPYQSAANSSGLYVPKRSRSPEKEGAPPFQYRALPRPEGYHIASPGPPQSRNFSGASSFSQETKSSDQNAQRLSSSKSSPLDPNQGPSLESVSQPRVAPPRPPRSPGWYNLDPLVHPRFRSTSAPFVLPFGQGPSAGQAESSPSPSPTQSSRAKPLLFNAAESSTSSPLVPPHEPGGYNPLLNPHLPKSRNSSPKPTVKKSVWKRAFRKLSDRQAVAHHSARAVSPIGRFRSATSPFPRPRAPTPDRGQILSRPQATLSGPDFIKDLDCRSSEDSLPLNRVTKSKPLFSIIQEGAIDFNGDSGDNDWKVEALKKNKLQINRGFGSPDSVSGKSKGNISPYNQYPSKFPEFPETTASRPSISSSSQDSLKAFAEEPQGLGIDQGSVRPFSWQLPNSGTIQDSAATFIPTSKEKRIYRDPEDRYYSVTPRHINRQRAVQGSGEAGEWVEIPISKLEKSESSPVPSEFFVGKCEELESQAVRYQKPSFNQEQNSFRLPGETDLSKSYPEPIVGTRSPPKQAHRNIQTVRDRQLESHTPKSDCYRQAFRALTGGQPTDSICQYWDSRTRDLAVRKEADNIGNTRPGENAYNCRYPSPEGYCEDRSPSRGRGRVRENLSIVDEDIPREEECSIAKRRYLQERRKAARVRRLERFKVHLDRQEPGEGAIDKHLASQIEVDSPQSFTPKVSIRPPRTLSAAKRGVERRKRLAAATDEVGASSNKQKTFFEVVLGPTNDSEQQIVKNTQRAYGQSDCDKGAHKDLVASFDHAPPISERTNNRITNCPQQHSSHFREEDLLVCIRSKTGTVKELPVTPEHRAKIKTVLQQDTVYTPSVYSGDRKEPAYLHAAEVCVSPLAFKKSPTPPRSNEFRPKFPFPDNVDPFRTANAFLDSCLSVPQDQTRPTMDSLQVSSAFRSSTKTKAEEDARAMQKSVIESCKKAGRDPPKYVLMELIGKGSFGRVYKGKDINTTQIVAVKIIDIDESDTLNPRLADTYSEFMKEVNALKILSESKAKNINHVIEALPVGTAMWMITEYCGGGSIATLMKPTPDGLKEKFIIPILREVAEAVKWVHQAGIIHRDLKCANILITEDGGVQLCDFGVAGITETALDKRSTFIGTFHWMAPELFRGSQYGKEVDIWAFGCMTYEMATGLPPNAMSGVTGMDLGAYLKTHIPRLEGDNYSEGLKSLVAYCLQENPSDRPTIEAVQRHSYIYNTSVKYPSSGLSDLVKAFKLWESHGGTRKSLFAMGGAQGPSELSSTALSDDNWNFSTTPAFDQAVAQAANPQDIINVYGASVALSTDFGDETSRPIRQQQARPSRRRPPPEALAPLKAPLEKLFDPNTISNYKDNSIQHFNLQPNAASDLPLRDDSAHVSIRDTLIDLDAHDIPSELSSFSEMDTMKPVRRAVQDDSEEDYESGSGPDFARPALSDPVDKPNRRTQDWKFPSMAPPASANPEITRFPPLQRPNMTAASSTRSALVHHPTEPVSLPSQIPHNLAPPAPALDRMSLIDLDMSIPEPSRPSTADSTASQDNASANPFMWERHASIYNAQGHRSAREPSLYLDESSVGVQMRNTNTLQDLNEVSDFSASDAEGNSDDNYNGHRTRIEDQCNERYFEQSTGGHMQGDYSVNALPKRAPWNGSNSSSAAHSPALFHPLPPPPSAAVLSGTASHAEMHAESHRLFETLRTSLETFRETYETMPTRPPKSIQSTSGDDIRGAPSMHDSGSNVS